MTVPTEPDRRYDLVVFDFDGTLADSFPWFCSVLNGVADRYRFRRVEDGEIDTLRGMGASAIVRHLGIPAWKLPLISRHMTALAAREIDAIQLFPDIAPTIEDLHQTGLNLAIVSSNAEANVRRVLGPQLSSRITRYSCGAPLFGKTRHLKSVIRRTGITPQRTLYVGDETRDHDAACSAGCDFAAVAWGYTRGETLAASNPTILLDAPDDLLNAIVAR
ncbi:HAD hydrolase-like protein [Methylobacterium sp.]|uniref:HAD hydrolase-like protein n=1 Tax=Methylobacterium sp. TaxID=409 RepID=UPI0025D8A719|nr:HAD hydrolase-like protein [Methylobacterium sp.]